MNVAYLRYVLNIGISLLILTFLFTKVPFEQIISIVRHSRMDFFFLSVMIGALSVFVSALRWQILLKYLGYRYDLKFLSKLTFMTLFFNIYLPGGVVGEVVRVAILPEDKSLEADRKIHLAKIAASVVTDRVVGIIGLMLLAFIGFVFCHQLLLNSKILSIFGIMAFGVIAIFFLLFSRRIQDFVKKSFLFSLKILSPTKAALKNVTDALFIYRKNYSVFKKVIMLSILSHLCVVGYFFLLSRSIGLDINFLKLLAFVPVIEFVAAIPISFGGVGIRETAAILLFSYEGVAVAEAMSVSLLSFVVILILGMIGGILFIGRQYIKKI